MNVFDKSSTYSGSLSRTRNHVNSITAYDAARDTVTFSRQQFLKMSGIAKSMLDVAGQSINKRTCRVTMDLLDFDLQDLDTAAGSGRVTPTTPSSGRISIQGATNPRVSRIWSVDDKRRLSALKGKGWTSVRIAEAIVRTPTAISQQWRKQNPRI